MRIVGYRDGSGPVHVGSLSDDGGSVTPLGELEQFWNDPGGYLSRPPRDDAIRTSSVQLVPPVLPQARVICIGLNYVDHVAEGSFRDQEMPEYPTLFARWTQSLTVDGALVPIPADEAGLDWEGEVVAWVGSRLIDATPEEALAAVVGYPTFNDLTSRRAQKLTSQWILGKERRQFRTAGTDGARRRGRRPARRPTGADPGQWHHRSGRHHRPDDVHRRRHPRPDLRTFTIEPGDLLATGTPPVSATPALPLGCSIPVTSSRWRSIGNEGGVGAGCARRAADTIVDNQYRAGRDTSFG